MQVKRIVGVALLCGAILTTSAQRRPRTPVPVPTPSRDSTRTPGGPPITGGPAGAAGVKTGPKPYKDVITSKAISEKGLFMVHKVEDKFYFEIPDSVMAREIMAVTRFSKVPANSGVGRATYGGELTNQQTISFERGPSNNVFLRVITLVNVADTSQAIYKAVNNSNLNAIAAAFPIAAYTKDSSSVVIDVTDFFKGDNQVVSMSPAKQNVLWILVLLLLTDLIYKALAIFL